MTDRITTDDMRQFLLSILPGVNGAPDGDDRDEQIDLRAMAAAMACEHLPSSVLNGKAIGDALRSFHEWPSAAAVWHFLSVRHRAAPPSHPAPRVVRSEMPPYQNNKKVETNDDAL